MTELPDLQYLISKKEALKFHPNSTNPTVLLTFQSLDQGTDWGKQSASCRAIRRGDGDLILSMGLRRTPKVGMGVIAIIPLQNHTIRSTQQQQEGGGGGEAYGSDWD